MKAGDRVQTDLGPGTIVSDFTQRSWSFGKLFLDSYFVVDLDDHGHRSTFRPSELEPEREQAGVR